MATEIVKVDADRVVIGLGKFRLSLVQNQELMQEIGASQLVSIRRTFREEGSPAGSWPQLAASTIKRMGKSASGHKLLIGKGRLLNSITASARPGQVIIGTNLVYAPVHQYGSRDRSFGVGPRTRAQEDATVDVGEHSQNRVPYHLRFSLGQYPSGAAEGPLPEGSKQRLRVRLEGPRKASYVKERAEGPVFRRNVRASSRHQNIPPRPYLVFRPEDPVRIRGIVNRYVAKARTSAGLAGGQ